MDIFANTTESNSDSYLEIDRFKAKILEIWNTMLEETYDKYENAEMSKEDFIIENSIKFSDDPEPENEMDSMMEMLENLVHNEDDHEHIDENGKAPTYKGSNLKAHNEKEKITGGTYNVKNENTKNPTDSRSRVQSGSYVGTPSSSLSKKQDSKVIRKYTPLIEEMKEQIRSLSERQAIGKRRQLFR